MTLADENVRFWTFFNDFRHCFTTCLNTMESVSYRLYEKKLTIPRGSAHQNVLYNNNQQSQKPGFLIQVKSESKRRSTSDRDHNREENHHNTVRGPKLADVLNPCNTHSFRIAKTSMKKKEIPGAPGGIFDTISGWRPIVTNRHHSCLLLLLAVGALSQSRAFFKA